MRPELTGTGEATLDLVVYEDGTDLVAAVAERLEESRRGNVDATFALDRLDEDTAGFFRDKRFDRLNVVEISVSEAGDHGGERFLVFGVWCRR